MYIDDLLPTLARIAPRFTAGEVVNIGGREFRSVRELSDIVLAHTGADPRLVQYVSEDRHNVRNKRPVIAKAEKWLSHDPVITLETGIPKTVAWMRQVYSV
jgi:dTDP-glucose 4,6-dehydratase